MPRGTLEFMCYFCWEHDGDVDELEANEPKRLKLYQFTASLLRAFADISGSLEELGYSEAEIADIKKELTFYPVSYWIYKNYGKHRCTSHAIGWKTMCTLVLEDIRRNANVAAVATKKYTDMLMQVKAAKQKKETEKHKRELKAADKRIAELDKIIARLYEDSALGKISEERYRIMSSAYEQEQRELKEKRGQLAEGIEKAEEAYSDVENFVNLIQRYIDIKELDTKILNELIEKIVVHEKAVNEDGSKSQRVDIYYKFIGFIPMEQFIPAVLEKKGQVVCVGKSQLKA